MKNFRKDFHNWFAGLNSNQRMIFIATVILILLNVVIISLGITFFFRVMGKLV
ncbi:MAG TPA: hypothetical protein PK874_07300 [Desulfobacteraceae bacterium]|nr:hypothetical protein [Desulfobacteraceae bacterium]HPJ68719.1 hypothetical protein [Desulfobacteraceae bacterium]HPQ28082.1 hypothetical protein [Desulfobacteraceae bacterium]